MDLIADGSDAFLFHTEYLVPNYPAATFPSNAIRVFTATASAATSLNASGATTTELPDRSRLVKVPFTTLGSLDLTAVERIELDLFRVAPGSEFSLKSFQTIPEPATGTLLVLGAAAVAGLLPRHR